MAEFKTVADLGPDASRTYARGIKDLDTSLLKDSIAIPSRTQVPITTPAYPPPEFLGENQKISWADFPSLSVIPPNRVFADQILPGQDPKVALQKIEAVHGLDTEKKEIVSPFCEAWRTIQRDLEHVKGEMGRYHKG